MTVKEQAKNPFFSKQVQTRKVKSFFAKVHRIDGTVEGFKGIHRRKLRGVMKSFSDQFLQGEIRTVVISVAEEDVH